MRFVCMLNRTGSEWLCSMLNSLPLGYRAGEWLHPDNKWFPYERESPDLAVHWRSISRTADDLRTVVKCNIAQMKRFQDQVLAEFERDHRYVLLVRNDVLAQALSQFLLMVRSRGETPSIGCLDPEAVTELVRRFKAARARWVHWLEEKAPGYVGLIYEELVADPVSQLRAVVRHFDGPTAESRIPADFDHSGARSRNRVPFIGQWREAMRRYDEGDESWRAPLSEEVKGELFLFGVSAEEILRRRKKAAQASVVVAQNRSQRRGENTISQHLSGDRARQAGDVTHEREQSARHSSAGRSDRVVPAIGEESGSRARQWIMLLMPRGRVGSNLCLSVLNQSKDLVCHNEVLTVIKGSSQGRSRSEVWRRQENALKEILGRTPEAKQVVKVAATTICDVDAFCGLLAARPPRLLILDRRSLVRTAVSLIRGAAYAHWTQEHEGKARWGLREGDAVPELRPVIERSEFESCIADIRAGRAICDKVEASLGGAVRYYYEDMLPDIDAFMLDVIQQCGVDPFVYKVKFKKFSPDSLQECVANADDVLAMAAEMGIE